MDYMGILKRAWNIVWNNKILWLFGFFVMSGSCNSGSSRYTANGDTDFQAPMEAATRWVQENQLVVLVLFIVLALVAIFFFIMRIASTGGLIHLVDEAENGRPVLAGDGFSTGFRRFWRVLGVQLLLALPIILVALDGVLPRHARDAVCEPSGRACDADARLGPAVTAPGRARAAGVNGAR